MALKTKIEVEEGESAQEVLIKCVSHLLKEEVNPAEIGAALATESVNVLLTFAPNPESAYSVLFSALENVTERHVERLKGENEVSKDMDGMQNAPTSKLLQ